MTKQELRRYREIMKKIENLEAERQTVIKLVKYPDGLPHGSGVGDPTAEAGAKLADLAAEISDTIDLLRDERSRIEAVISRLPEREYNLMHNRYILGQTWEQVAVNMNYSYRRVLQLHGEILRKIQ